MNIGLATPLTVLTFMDYPEPDAHAVIISFVGCPHACPSCHNRFLQDAYGLTQASCADDSLPGKLLTFSSFELAKETIREQAVRNHTNKLVLQGGEPLLAGANLEFTKYLCACGEFEVCIYTGYNIDHAKQVGLTGFRYLKCGLFDIQSVRPSMKTDERFILASPNQEFYDSEFRQISMNGVLSFTEIDNN